MVLALRISIAAVFLACGMYSFGWAADDVKPAKEGSNVIAEYEVHTDGDMLLAPVVVGGQEHAFALDTGFSTTTFDDRLRGALARDAESTPVRVTGAGTLHTAVAREFSIKGLPPFRDVPVWRGDLSRIREATGHDIAGIIGIDLLRLMVVRIDADTGRLQFLKRRPQSSVKPIAIGFRRSGTPTISVSLAAGVTENLIVDTGNFSLDPIVDLSASLYQDLERRRAVRTLYRSAASRVDRIQETQTGILAAMAFADGQTLQNVRVAEHPEGLNLLGVAALLQFNAILDFPAGELLLEPRQKVIDRKFPVEGSGLVLLRREGTTFVHSVRKASRAERAGLQRGDIVEFAAAKGAAEYRLHDLRLLLETEGPDVQLAVRAGGGELRKILLSRRGN